MSLHIVAFAAHHLSLLLPWGGRSTTPLGPTLPSLVTAREYRPGPGPRMGSACNIESQPTTCQVLRPLVVLETAPSAEVNKML